MYCNSAAKCNCGAERPHSIPIQGLMNKPRTKSKSQKFATVLKQAKPVGKTLGWYIAPHNVAVLQHNCRRARNTNPLAKLKLLQHRVFALGRRHCFTGFCCAHRSLLVRSEEHT